MYIARDDEGVWLFGTKPIRTEAGWYCNPDDMSANNFAVRLPDSDLFNDILLDEEPVEFSIKK